MTNTDGGETKDTGPRPDEAVGATGLGRNQGASGWLARQQGSLQNGARPVPSSGESALSRSDLVPPWPRVFPGL